jgi:hypothetical protein
MSFLIPAHEDAQLLRKSLPASLTNARLAVEVVILNNDPRQDVGAGIGEAGADPRVRILAMGYEAVSRVRSIEKSDRARGSCKEDHEVSWRLRLAGWQGIGGRFRSGSAAVADRSPE